MRGVKQPSVEVKTAMPTPGMPDPAELPAAPDAQMPDAPQMPVPHAWAGDALDTLDGVTDPEQAHALFTGPQGEQAWLDRADDGVLLGWVRDVDGQVYRYNDVDAWAVDVDDAGFERQGDAPAAEPAEPVQDEEQGQDLEDLPMMEEDAEAAGGASSTTREKGKSPFPELDGKSFQLQVTPL